MPSRPSPIRRSPAADPPMTTPAAATAPVRRRTRAALAKYLAIFRVSLAERMTYRGDFLLGTILRFLPMVTTILLWQAIYEGTDQAPLGSRQITFSYNEMIAYLLLTHISRMFSSMPGLAGGIAREIREGTLKRYLLQPIDMIGYLLSYRVAHKVAYIVTSFYLMPCCSSSAADIFDGFPDPTDARGLRRLAGPGLPGRVLLRGQRGDGRVLVPGGHVAAVHRDDLELLHLGAHAAARPAPRAVGAACSRPCRSSTWPISRPSSSWAR